MQQPEVIPCLWVEEHHGHDLTGAAGAHSQLFPVAFVCLRAVNRVLSRPGRCAKEKTGVRIIHKKDGCHIHMAHSHPW